MGGIVTDLEDGGWRMVWAPKKWLAFLLVEFEDVKDDMGKDA